MSEQQVRNAFSQENLSSEGSEDWQNTQNIHTPLFQRLERERQLLRQFRARAADLYSELQDNLAVADSRGTQRRPRSAAAGQINAVTQALRAASLACLPTAETPPSRTPPAPTTPPSGERRRGPPRDGRPQRTELHDDREFSPVETPPSGSTPEPSTPPSGERRRRPPRDVRPQRAIPRHDPESSPVAAPDSRRRWTGPRRLFTSEGDSPPTLPPSFGPFPERTSTPPQKPPFIPPPGTMFTPSPGRPFSPAPPPTSDHPTPPTPGSPSVLPFTPSPERPFTPPPGPPFTTPSGTSLTSSPGCPSSPTPPPTSTRSRPPPDSHRQYATSPHSVGHSFGTGEQSPGSIPSTPASQEIVWATSSEEGYNSRDGSGFTPSDWNTGSPELSSFESGISTPILTPADMSPLPLPEQPESTCIVVPNLTTFLLYIDYISNSFCEDRRQRLEEMECLIKNMVEQRGNELQDSILTLRDLTIRRGRMLPDLKTLFNEMSAHLKSLYEAATDRHNPTPNLNNLHILCNKPVHPHISQENYTKIITNLKAFSDWAAIWCLHEITKNEDLQNEVEKLLSNPEDLEECVRNYNREIEDGYLHIERIHEKMSCCQQQIDRFLILWRETGCKELDKPYPNDMLRRFPPFPDLAIPELEQGVAPGALCQQGRPQKPPSPIPPGQARPLGTSSSPHTPESGPFVQQEVVSPPRRPNLPENKNLLQQRMVAQPISSPYSSEFDLPEPLGPSGIQRPFSPSSECQGSEQEIIGGPPMTRGSPGQPRPPCRLCPGQPLSSGMPRPFPPFAVQGFEQMAVGPPLTRALPGQPSPPFGQGYQSFGQPCPSGMQMPFPPYGFQGFEQQIQVGSPMTRVPPGQPSPHFGPGPQFFGQPGPSGMQMSFSPSEFHGFQQRIVVGPPMTLATPGPQRPSFGPGAQCFGQPAPSGMPRPFPPSGFQVFEQQIPIRPPMTRSLPAQTSPHYGPGLHRSGQPGSSRMSIRLSPSFGFKNFELNIPVVPPMTRGSPGQPTRPPCRLCPAQPEPSGMPRPFPPSGIEELEQTRPPGPHMTREPPGQPMPSDRPGTHCPEEQGPFGIPFSPCSGDQSCIGQLVNHVFPGPLSHCPSVEDVVAEFDGMGDSPGTHLHH